MKTIKKEIVKSNGIYYVAISLAIVFVLGLGVTVSANQTFKQLLADSVAKIIAPQVISDINTEVPSEEALGAVSGPDYYWDYQNFNGLTTYVKTGGFIDASTTIASVQNPAGATSTMDLAILDVSGAATSTWTVVCGTSTTAYGSPTQGIISSGSVVTSTLPYILNDATYDKVDGGAVNKIIVAPTEWIVCKITSTHTNAFTDVTNTFDGKYKFVFKK